MSTYSSFSLLCSWSPRLVNKRFNIRSYASYKPSLKHNPVLLQEVIEYIKPPANFGNRENIFIDCTFGYGGHARELLKNNPKATLIGIDRDRNLLKNDIPQFYNDFPNRFWFISGKFGDILLQLNSWLRIFDRHSKNPSIITNLSQKDAEIIEQLKHGSSQLQFISSGDNSFEIAQIAWMIFQQTHINITTSSKSFISSGVSGILMDLGVSSGQLDSRRGFSFREEFNGPLDMRMDTSTNTSHSLRLFKLNDIETAQRNNQLTAYDLINFCPEGPLANLLYKYGEENLSRLIAKAVCQNRQKKRIENTFELAEITRRVYKAVYKEGSRMDPASKTFQALRIVVNDELNQLRKGLCGAEQLLLPGGRIGAISFHSLEEKIIIDYFDRCSKDTRPSMQITTAGPIIPSAEEVKKNPRSRSAKMRVATRLDAPPKQILLEDPLFQ